MNNLKRPLARILALATLSALVALGAIAGCGTVASTALYGPCPYVGLRHDLYNVANYDALPDSLNSHAGTVVLNLLDAPFSAAADTALLPITIFFAERDPPFGHGFGGF